MMIKLNLMKILLTVIFFAWLLLSCCQFNNSDYQSDNYRKGSLIIYNYSDSAIYVYMKCGIADSLPLEPGLELFMESKTKNTDKCGNLIFEPIISPEYRVNAFKHGSLTVGGNEDNPSLLCDSSTVTLFFIKEKTMHDYDWEQIYKGQIYAERITFTEKELTNLCWRYSYIPPELRRANGTVLIPFYGYPGDE
jgi:lipoprotein